MLVTTSYSPIYNLEREIFEMEARQHVMWDMLPRDVVEEIVGKLAMTSITPLQDVCSLRVTCKSLKAACFAHTVAGLMSVDHEMRMFAWWLAMTTTRAPWSG